MRLLTGPVHEMLPTIGERTVDATTTDPPYHIQSIFNRFGKPGAVNAKGEFARSSKGFLGETWDGGDVAFRPETWIQVMRTMKPGAWLLAFGHPRNYHWMTTAIELAGFEIQNSISCLMWAYGTGSPKGNVKVAQAVAKVAAEFDLDPELVAAHWEDWGTILKPATEPVVLARVPLEESTIARQVLATGTGALNIGACKHSAKKRWPTNMVLCHLPECGPTDETPCVPGCVVREMAEQGGPRGSGSQKETCADFFPSFRYCAKPSVKEKEYGLEALEPEVVARLNPGGLSKTPGGKPVVRRNVHATPKPVALMEWLIKLVARPGALVSDPFLGSGTTGVAAVHLGNEFVGIDKNPRYIEIAKARITAALLDRIRE